MGLRKLLSSFKNSVKLLFFRISHSANPSFICPICGYRGPFADFVVPTGTRKNAQCPNCDALERARIQYIVMTDFLNKLDTNNLGMLHVSPEPFFRNLFSRKFAKYTTTDLVMTDVDYQADLQNLPFDDESFDIVFASHVLEHVPDDNKALSEIRRILTKNGIAILPVPLVAEKTIEYPEPNPNETYHVRAPGYDYFDRYEKYFSRIEKYSSDTLPENYQLYIYEDRTKWPTKESPLRLPMQGEKHPDVIPICYK